MDFTRVGKAIAEEFAAIVRMKFQHGIGDDDAGIAVRHLRDRFGKLTLLEF